MHKIIKQNDKNLETIIYIGAKQKENIHSTTRGITLIALVITIVLNAFAWS